MSSAAGPNVLRAAKDLIRDHPPTPELPADMAVHAAILLAEERPCYTNLSRPGGMSGTLVFTLVTRTRVLQLAATEHRSPEGVGISTDVRPLAWPA